MPGLFLLKNMNGDASIIARHNLMLANLDPNSYILLALHHT
jgi:hypothetical protein